MHPGTIRGNERYRAGPGGVLHPVADFRQREEVQGIPGIHVVGSHAEGGVMPTLEVFAHLTVRPMTTTTLDAKVHDFLAQRRIAVAEVSRDNNHHPASNLI